MVVGRVTAGERTSLAALMLFALLWRAWPIGARSLQLDEVITVTWETASIFRGLYNGNGPLFLGFLAAWRQLFGDSAVALRLPNVLLGTLTLVPVWWVARRLLADRGAALLAAGALAVVPNALFYSQQARMYALFLFGVALATAGAVELVRETSRPRWALPAYVVGLVLALGGHNYALFFALPLAIWVTVRRGGNASLELHAPLLAVGLAWVLWLSTSRSGDLWAYIQRWAASPHWGRNPLLTIGQTFILPRGMAQTGPFGWWGAGAVAFLAFGVVLLWRRGQRRAARVTAWLLTAPWLLVVPLPIARHPRYLLPWLVAFVVGLAAPWALRFTMSAAGRWMLGAVYVAVFVAALVMDADFNRRDLEPWRGICETIAEQSLPGAKVATPGELVERSLRQCTTPLPDVVHFPPSSFRLKGAARGASAWDGLHFCFSPHEPSVTSQARPGLAEAIAPLADAPDVWFVYHQKHQAAEEHALMRKTHDEIARWEGGPHMLWVRYRRRPGPQSTGTATRIPTGTGAAP